MKLSESLQYKQMYDSGYLPLFYCKTCGVKHMRAKAANRHARELKHEVMIE